MGFKEFYENEQYPYAIIEVEEKLVPTELKSIVESQWKHSGEGDIYYRVDPPDPEKGFNRHIHLSHKKHLKSPNKQVSWNDDQSRHDQHKFDSSFKGLKAVKDIAKRILKLPDNAILENDDRTAVKLNYMFESAEDRPSEIYLLRVVIPPAASNR